MSKDVIELQGTVVESLPNYRRAFSIRFDTWQNHL